MEWQPIETAPRDGTTVLLWKAAPTWPVGGRPRRYPRVADYRVGLWVGPRAELPSGGWRYLSHGYEFGQDDRFSHWMPLPKPPTRQQGRMG